MESFLITKNATGLTVTPAPEPPPKGYLLSESEHEVLLNSLPPDAKPTHTLEMGIIVVPSSYSTGSPTMVFTSIISLILSMVLLIKFSIG